MRWPRTSSIAVDPLLPQRRFLELRSACYFCFCCSGDAAIGAGFGEVWIDRLCTATPVHNDDLKGLKSKLQREQNLLTWIKSNKKAAVIQLESSRNLCLSEENSVTVAADICKLVGLTENASMCNGCERYTPPTFRLRSIYVPFTFHQCSNSNVSLLKRSQKTTKSEWR